MDLCKEFKSTLSDYISVDNSIQILKWLPVKTLLRFRCVCKCWKDIIDSQLFIKEHIALQKPRLIVEYEEPKFLVLDPHTLPLVESLSGPTVDYEAKPYRLVGTLHGVICLYDDCHKFLLWNPSIHKFSRLSIPENMHLGRDDDDDDDDDDELPDPPYFSFWIDPSSKNFKILVFKLISGPDSLFAQESELKDGVRYSSVRQDWIAVPLNKLRGYTPLIEGPPVMIGEMGYWRAHHEWISGGKRYKNMVILSFDFVQECFNIIEIPHKDYYRWLVMHCKLQGALSLVHWYEEHPYGCDVFLMQEGVWVKKFGFNLPPYISCVFWVLEEREGRCKALASVSGALVSYDTKDYCIVLKSGLENISSIYMGYDFVESLLFP